MYLSPSDDETAFLFAMDQIGYKLLESSEKKMLIDRNGQMTTLYPKAHFPFDSTRKMMSQVMKNERGEYVLMCKGADTAILHRLKFKTNQEEEINELKRVIKLYSDAGLRTMIFGQVKFTVGMYKKFLVLVKKIRSVPIEELMDEFDYFEQNLEFLGITAVQDELQPNVG